MNSRWIGSLLLLVFCLTSWCVTPALPEQIGSVAFRVHPETIFQTMIGFGAGFNEQTLTYFNFIKKSEDRARAYDLLYGDDGVRLNIVRLTVSVTQRQNEKEESITWQLME